MDKILFGTGGWRAVIGEDFICKNIRRVAKGISLLMKEDNKTDKPVIIGFDRRFLSENAAKWVAEVLTNDGIRVLFMERSVPTPLVMHTVKDRGLDFGIEITASHNPSSYNGIKLIVEEGRDAPVETTERLEKLIENIDEVDFTAFDSAVENGLVEYINNPFNKFLDDIIDVIDMDALRNRGLRVLFDTMHGSGTYPLLVIFYTARCTIDTMNLNKDAYDGLKYYFRHFDPNHEREDEIFERLGYIDIQNLAKRMKAKLLMFTGLMDTICPPSTQFAMFNKVTSEKDVVIYPEFGHEGLKGCQDKIFAFMNEL